MTIKNVTFIKETFSGSVDNFDSCEFHDCVFDCAIIRQMTGCKLFSTKLVKSDLTQADVSFTETNNCEVSGCKWIGVRAVLDCGFFSGLKFHDRDPFLLMILATIPESPEQSEIISKLPIREQKKRALILAKPFRKS